MTLRALPGGIGRVDMNPLQRKHLRGMGQRIGRHLGNQAQMTKVRGQYWVPVGLRMSVNVQDVAR